jgi:tRNA-modifying protein YgfZ
MSDLPPPAAVPVSGPGQAIVCDLSPLSVLAIEGPDASTFLQGQLSNDVSALAPGRAHYTSYNSPKGRMLANFVLWREGAGFRALLPADLAEPVRKRLAMYVLRSKVTLADVSAATARFGVGGPGASAALLAALGTAPGPFAVATSGTATVLGLLQHASTAPFDTWRWLTIRAGVPIVTAPTQDQFVAQTANWDVLGGISFQKGCYTGQEIIARTQHLGRLKERTYAFHVDATDVVAGARVYSRLFGDQACGTIVNAAPAPGGGTDVLAVVQTAASDAGDVRLGAPDGPRLAALALPYALPAPAAPRGRIG